MKCYNEIHGASIFDVYDYDKINVEHIEDLEVCLRDYKNEFQNFKLGMAEIIRSFEETVNRLQEAAIRNISARGRARGGNAHEEVEKAVKKPNRPAKRVVETATNSQVLTKSQRLMTFPSKQPPPKRRGARTVPTKIQHRTSHARKPEKGSRGNSSKHGSGFGSQPQKLGRIPRSSFSWWRVRVSSHALPSHVKENLFATHGKRPFDRGRARLVRRGEVNWTQRKSCLIYDNEEKEDNTDSEEEQVPGKPPPLRDKKFARIIWLGEQTEQVQTSFQWFASNLEDKVLWRMVVLMSADTKEKENKKEWAHSMKQAQSKVCPTLSQTT